MQEEIDTIQKEAASFFKKIGAQGEVQVNSQEEEGVVVELTTDEPQLYIGEKGQTLAEIQHILRQVIKKKLGHPLLLSLDINSYRKNKENYLRELAKETADEVALLKKEKELESMPAAERRIVHMVLAERTDVVSESAGEGEERRVVVKPKT